MDQDEEFMVASAVRHVARYAIGRAVQIDPPEWEDFPEIGEHDWQRVEAEIKRYADQFEGQTEKYRAAYQFLADRADGDAA